jgi:oligoribonuclease
MSTDSKIHSKYLWIDLEMTGLDVEKERIIEIGAIATDTDLNELDRFHCIVKQPQELLDKMDAWNTKHHGDSGLTAKVSKGLSETDAEKELSEWCQKIFDEPIIIAGNSIGQDRLFLTKYFKDFSKLMHYRQLDVTAFKLAYAPKGLVYNKNNTHRAIDDIVESIEEFKFFTSKERLSSL